MKQLLTKLLREALVSREDFQIQDDVIGSHHGQVDCHIKLMKDGVVLAYADYSIFQGKIQIKYIETAKQAKGKGYGRELMKYLADKYGYENLERSSLTPSGVEMRKKLDKEFGFDYEKHLESQNKHLDPKLINKVKEPIVREFLKDIVNNGYDATWDKYKKMPEFEEYKGEYDFNDVSDLSQWFKTSKTNKNNPNDAPPDDEISFLGKLIGKELEK